MHAALTAAIEPNSLSIGRLGPRAPIRVGATNGRFSDGLLDLALDAITDCDTFKRRLKLEIAARKAVFSSYAELLGFIDQVNLDLMRSFDETLGFDPIDLKVALGTYRRMVTENQESYDSSRVANPNAYLWPALDRIPSRSIFETVPAVENLGLVSKSTPIGSAGSCFATEIATALQRRGFNYVVKETEAEDAVSGVFHHGFRPSEQRARFSATYGRIYNTAGFRQLAEKAFDLRHPPRLLLPINHERANGDVVEVLFDPFRESVAYHSVEAFEANYRKHQDAVREVLTSCDVFVITLGLTECWELISDGSVLSGAPAIPELYPLVRKRVLSVEENVANVQRMIDIVRSNNPGIKFIISVSPVPLAKTFRRGECHVITANAYSKAVLRVAAEELVQRNRDVFYFPSYETVTVCTETPYADDQRHVTPLAVANVMAVFDAMFVA